MNLASHARNPKNKRKGRGVKELHEDSVEEMMNLLSSALPSWNSQISIGKLILILVATEKVILESEKCRICTCQHLMPALNTSSENSF